MYIINDAVMGCIFCVLEKVFLEARGGWIY